MNNMTGVEIIEEVSKKFEESNGKWNYYLRYTEGENGEELCLESEILSMFEKSSKVTQYSWETEHFDGGPAYEATIIFFAWTDEIGTLHTDQVLTECM